LKKRLLTLSLGSIISYECSQTVPFLKLNLVFSHLLFSLYSITYLNIRTTEIGLSFIGNQVSYCAYNFASAEKRIKELCSNIPLGMSFTQLSDFANQHGLSRPHSDNGTTFITESKTFGRYACEIQLSNGIVQHVKYNFAD
jgi:hypothetical protein